MKRIISIMLSGAMLLSVAPYPTVAEQEMDVFYDDFSDGRLDSDKWLVAYKNWGWKSY